MKQREDTQTALEILQANAHREVKSVVSERTETTDAFFDVVTGGEALFSLARWIDCNSSILDSHETVGEWLVAHPLTVARWEKSCHASEVETYNERVSS